MLREFHCSVLLGRGGLLCVSAGTIRYRVERLICVCV